MRVEINAGKFVGYCELPDYLTIQQCREFEEALFGDPDELESEGAKKVWLSVKDEKMLPVLIRIVTGWHIAHIPELPTVDTFPGTPRKYSNQVLTQITNAVVKLWSGEDVPNA